MDKNIEFLHKHCEFKSPYDCYVLLAVSRKKDTEWITNNTEIVFKEVIKNQKDIEKKYNKIEALCKSYKDHKGRKYPFYIYITLNARDSLNATFELMKKIDLWIKETMRGCDRSAFFKKVYGHFYSSLMEKEGKSKSTNYWMIDYDNKTDFPEFRKAVEKDTKILSIKETKNGYHLKIKPFDTRQSRWVCPDLIKRDALFFVNYIKNGKNRNNKFENYV